MLRKVFRGSKYNQEVETLPSRGGGIQTRISPCILCIVQVHEWLFKTTIWVQLLPYEDSAYVGITVCWLSFLYLAHPLLGTSEKGGSARLSIA